MTEPPEFSVVVPTHGRAHLLPLALESLRHQTITDFEVVVVDDGGTGSVELPHDSRFRVVARREQGGAAAARNTGIAAARGRYLTFLDDDDEFTPRRLELARAGLTRAPVALCWKAGLARGDLRWARDLTGRFEGVILEAAVPQLGSGAFDRSIVPPFQESLRVSEDVEFWLRMSLLAPASTVREVGYLIRDHEGERLRDRTAERLETRLWLLETYADYFARHPRAAAYQWLRAGGLAAAVGDRQCARQAYVRSFRARPSSRSLARLTSMAFVRGATA